MKYEVIVESQVNIEIENPDLFSEAFFKEFERYMYNVDHTIEAHVENLAERFVSEGEPNFIEGYGELKERGIKISVVATDSYLD